MQKYLVCSCLLTEVITREENDLLWNVIALSDKVFGLINYKFKICAYL